jgi:hypothetical protein
MLVIYPNLVLSFFYNESPNKGRVFAAVVVLRSKACHSKMPVTHKITAEMIDSLDFVILTVFLFVSCNCYRNVATEYQLIMVDIIFC